MGKCAECRNCYKPDGAKSKEVCLADLWDRNEDDFLHEQEDFYEYIYKERLCTDFSIDHRAD